MDKIRLAVASAAIALTWVAGGCSSSRMPAIREIYANSARSPIRNPVVVLHGILGSRLEQRSTGRAVWGAFTNDYYHPGTPEGARAIALPLEPPRSAADYDPARADIYPTGPLGAIQLSFLFSVVSVEVYANILRTLGVGGYLDQVGVDPGAPAYAEDHYNCYTFFYDWRRDNIENALQFGRYLQNTRKEIGVAARKKVETLRATGDAEDSKRADEIHQWLADGFRFDIVAHSMGGLIDRYYLRYGAQDLPADGSLPDITWAGAEEVDRLIIVGTPSLGSIESFSNLVSGFSPSLFLPSYHHALLGTMPSLYQLLPRKRHGCYRDERGEAVSLDPFDVEVWDRNGWGMLDPASAGQLEWLMPNVADTNQRRGRAKKYLEWCLNRAQHFHASLDQRASSQPPTRVYLFASDTESTPGAVRLRSETKAGVERLRPYKIDRTVGDGTVPRFSALADERTGGEFRPRLDSPIPWHDVTFLSDDHIGLTKNVLFTNNLLHILLEEPQPIRLR